MLPNHAPLVIAEQIGTLATLHPGRVGLGLGRAPGTDPLTASALRRRDADPAHFANEVLETLAYLGAIPDDALSAVPGSLLPPSAVVGCESDSPAARPAASERRVRAIPGEGTDPDAWILGSSVNGARVAGRLGLPFTFASHFAPAQAEAVITTYRSYFGGPDDAGPRREEAEFLFSTAMAGAARVLGGRPGPLDRPTADPRAWRDLAGGRDADVEASMGLSFVGAPDAVADGLRGLAARWGLEEVLVVTSIHDAAARRRSYTLLADAWRAR